MMSLRSRWLLVIVLLSVALATSAQDVTVYITKTGSKYHREGCTSLSRSSIPVSLSNAIGRGYAPCKICSPPTATRRVTPPTASSASEPTATNETPAELYRVDRDHLATSSKADTSSMLATIVSRTIDGDTIEVTIPGPPAGLSTLEKVRLIGIDAPEISDSSERVRAAGLEASAFTRKSLLGKIVLLAFESTLRDEYKRVLAYVYLQDGSCFNSELVRLGYARTYTEFPCQFMNELLDLEKQARVRSLGMWKQ